MSKEKWRFVGRSRLGWFLIWEREEDGARVHQLVSRFRAGFSPVRRRIRP